MKNNSNKMKYKYFIIPFVLLLATSPLMAQDGNNQIKQNDSLNLGIQIINMQIETLIKKHIAVWNERNVEIRSALIKELYADDVEVIATFAVAKGHSELSNFVSLLLARFDGYDRILLKPINVHSNFVKLSWALADTDKTYAATGQDIIFIKNGKITKVLTFIDKTKTYLD